MTSVAPVDLLLLRHPRVALPPGICYGQLDAPAAQPLNPSWQQVATQLDASLASLNPAAPLRVGRVVSSPLQRARALAQPLAQHFQAPLLEDARWQELHFGHWEGRAWAEIDRAESDPWAADPHTHAPPGGETQAALHQRVAAALAELADLAGSADAAAGTCLIVSHAGPIRCALAIALGLPAAQVPELALDFGRLTWLRWHAGTWPRWAVQAVNR